MPDEALGVEKAQCVPAYASTALARSSAAMARQPLTILHFNDVYELEVITSNATLPIVHPANWAARAPFADDRRSATSSRWAATPVLSARCARMTPSTRSSSSRAISSRPRTVSTGSVLETPTELIPPTDQVSACWPNTALAVSVITRGKHMVEAINRVGVHARYWPRISGRARAVKG